MGIIGVLVAVLIIGFIILIHEFGHYIVGKLSGCSVSQFSIGWGPKLLSFKRRETDYRISWIPFIGGYVRMPGMEGESAELTKEETEDIKKYNLKTFEELRTWQKFLTFIGGVGLQIIICTLILTVVISILGKPVTKVVVAEVTPNSPAEVSGISRGDVIIKADAEEIDSVEVLISFIADKADKPVLLTIEREEEIKTLTVIPRYSEEYKRALMGIQLSPFTDYKKDNMKWHDYIFGGIIFTGTLSRMLIKGIWQLITHPENLKSVLGPVGIVVVTKEVIKLGFLQFLLFFAMININLAIINLLPIPALDGGHVLMLSIEKLIRIKIKLRVKEAINMVGFIFIISLMLYVTYYNILWISGSKNKENEKIKQIEVQPERKR